MSTALGQHVSGERADIRQPWAPAVLARAPLFHGLADDAITALMSRMEFLEVLAGTVLFRQGDPGDYLYLIVSGGVRLSRSDADKADRLVALLGPPDHFGELSLLDPGPRTSSATVVDHARLARLDKPSLDLWMTERPEIALQMLRVVSRRLRRTRTHVSDMIFVDVPGRVAGQLLELARRFGSVHDGRTLVEHNLTQAELADLVGSSRETVNKALSDFANRGWLRLGKGSVTILDRERLSRRAR